MFEDDDSVFAALRAGARGYLLKGADEPSIVTARSGRRRRGEAIFGPALARRLLRAGLRHGRGRRRSVPFPQLTEREREILDADRRRAAPTPQIARSSCSCSPKTVRNHVSTIFTKLQVADARRRSSRAREAGLGRTD